ncbi:MAG: metallophosphoesterase [Filimonas sp.]|nr:metallophosphoesterase [Filimonas sp.]
MKRRNFLQATGALLGGSTLLSANAFAGKDKNNKGTIRFAFISDIHVKPGAVPEAGMAKALQHIQQLNPKVDFIINGGDSIMDALEASKEKTQTQFDLYKSILQKENKLPVYHTIGNHDIWGWFSKDTSLKDDRLYGKTWVVETLGMPKRYYRFQKGKWHFIILDSTQQNPAGGYIGKLDEEQLNWLKAELPAIPKDDFICIVSHIPILSICAGLFFDKNEPNGDLLLKRNLMHSDAIALKKLFRQYPQIKTALSGHIHLQDEVEYLGINYYCNGAISGNWWSGAFQEFNPAYAVFELYPDGSSKRWIMEY